jgi:hypothetical protein
MRVTITCSMRLRSIGWLVVVLIALSQNAFGQAFVNLDFEQSTIVSSNYDSEFGFYYGTANVPGWTGGLGTNLFLYNDLSLGSPSVTLVGTGWGSIDGAFSMMLQAFPIGGASISQTGLVPIGTESLLFKAQQSGVGIPAGTLQISLGGQNLSFFALSSGANYTLYGADISNFAGRTEQLTFSALEDASGDNFCNIDDIQFSPSSVPEPSTLGLIALGGLLFGLRRSN